MSSVPIQIENFKLFGSEKISKGAIEADISYKKN